MQYVANYTTEKYIAPALGFEPKAFGFGDRCATNYATPENKKSLLDF